MSTQNQTCTTSFCACQGDSIPDGRAQRRLKAINRIVGLGALGALFLLTGCANTTTVFQSSFNSNPPGSTRRLVVPQAVGSIQGDCTVQPAPPGAQTAGNWLEVTNIGLMTGSYPGTVPTVGCSFQPTVPFSPKVGISFVADFYIPAGSVNDGAVVSFTASQMQPQEFLNLLFLPNNTVRLADATHVPQVFGTFPRGQSFTVFITLNSSVDNVGVNTVVANVGLAGTGASGHSSDYFLTPSIFAGTSFNGVAISSASLGAVYVNNIKVTYNNQ